MDKWQDVLQIFPVQGRWVEFNDKTDAKAGTDA